MPLSTNDYTKNFDVQAFLADEHLTVDDVFAQYPIAAAIFINYYRIKSDPSFSSDWKAYHDSYLIMVTGLKNNWMNLTIEHQQLLFHLVDRELAKAFFYRRHYQAEGFSLDLCPLGYESKFEDILQKFLTSSLEEQKNSFNFIFSYVKNTSLVLKGGESTKSLDLLIRSFRLDNQEQWFLLLLLIYAVPSLDISVERNNLLMKHIDSLNLDEKIKFKFTEMQRQVCYELMTKSNPAIEQEILTSSKEEIQAAHLLKLYLKAAKESKKAEKEMKKTLKNYLFQHHKFWDGWWSFNAFKKTSLFVGGVFLSRWILNLLSAGVDFAIGYLLKMSIGTGIPSLLWGAFKIASLFFCFALKAGFFFITMPSVFAALSLGLAYYAFFHSKVAFYHYFLKKGKSLYEKIAETIESKFTSSFFEKTNKFSDFEKSLQEEIHTPLKKHGHHSNQVPKSSIELLFNKIKGYTFFQEIKGLVGSEQITREARHLKK